MHGIEDIFARFWTDLVSRLTGPMTFRLILQAMMATIYAFRDGIKDAHEGRPAYFWSFFAHPELKGALLREGAKAVGRVIILGIVMDVIYQVTVFRRLYPLELVVVVLALAFIPYLLFRGPVSRIARRWLHGDNGRAMPGDPRSRH
jgi:hypothetical protein